MDYIQFGIMAFGALSVCAIVYVARHKRARLRDELELAEKLDSAGLKEHAARARQNATRLAAVVYPPGPPFPWSDLLFGVGMLFMCLVAAGVAVVLSLTVESRGLVEHLVLMSLTGLTTGMYGAAGGLSLRDVLRRKKERR